MEPKLNELSEWNCTLPPKASFKFGIFLTPAQNLWLLSGPNQCLDMDGFWFFLGSFCLSQVTWWGHVLNVVGGTIGRLQEARIFLISFILVYLLFCQNLVVKRYFLDNCASILLGYLLLPLCFPAFTLHRYCAGSVFFLWCLNLSVGDWLPVVIYLPLLIALPTDLN